MCAIFIKNCLAIIARDQQKLHDLKFMYHDLEFMSHDLEFMYHDLEVMPHDLELLSRYLYFVT